MMNEKQIEEARQEILQIFSDTHKDAYGFRPRFSISDWSLEELQAEMDVMSREISQQIEEERVAQEREAAQLEQLVADTIKRGYVGGQHVDRSQALRWIFEEELYSEEFYGDLRYLMYSHNLPDRYYIELRDIFCPGAA